MEAIVRYEVQGHFAVLTIDNPPVNALGTGVAQGILAGLKQGMADTHVKAFILIGAGRTFVAGADIKEFVKVTRGEATLDHSIHSMLEEIENCPKPVYCAIHGTALGGGLEIALACHNRVAVATAQVGQPEVKLGLIPGAGGTQRLPRLIGVPLAAQMCVSGDLIPATKANDVGLIDWIVPGDLLEGAKEYAQKQLDSGITPPRTRDRSGKLNAEADAETLKTLKGHVANKSRGLIAPLKVLEAMDALHTMSFEDALKKESTLFQECLHSDQSKGLIHTFLAEREVSKIPGLPKDTAIKKIQMAAVVGAGTMGGGIAMNYANAGIPVLLKEMDQEALDRGLSRIRANYQASVDKGKLTPQQLEQRMGLIRPTLTYERFQEVDIVVEAVFEGMELKRRVFRELDGVVRPDAIMATNTSTLDVDQIANATSRPQQVIGHHFFSPANVMKLLEIVRGQASSPEVIATSMALAKTLNKVGVLVGNCRGFVGNRMFDPYTREAQFLLEEGASVMEVDGALTQWGMAMGPHAVCDLAGLDVCWRIRQEYQHERPKDQRDVLVVDRLYEMGRYGQKTGAGWYRYDGRNATSDPVVEELIAQCANQAGITRTRLSSDEIIERTVYTLINEGAKILEEGMALRALDIDIIYVYGYGFPAFRGGPMFYADTVGLKRVYDRVCQFEQIHGPLWKPAKLLGQLAADGGSFSDWVRH